MTLSTRTGRAYALSPGRTGSRPSVSSLWQSSTALIPPVPQTSNKKKLQNVSQREMSTGTQHSEAPTAPVLLDPLVVCGPSGVGKGTIIEQFMKNNGNDEDGWQFGFSVSHTTRKPRPGEQDGVHYHFVSHETMQDLISQNSNNDNSSNGPGYFLEHAHVHGNYYGTSWQALRQVQEQSPHHKCLLDIDVQGVQRLKQLEAQLYQEQLSSSSSGLPTYRLQPKYVFIAPPSLDALQKRLKARNTETPEQLAVRLGKSATEVAYGMQPGQFHAVVVNDDLDQAVQEFTQVVRNLYPPRAT
uniref:Guanylate kinase-like domain-containing protein n=1 Tax=Entomoneis paludosa TaxID=265537 RepID=A0A7S3DYF2_9STRA